MRQLLANPLRGLVGPDRRPALLAVSCLASVIGIRQLLTSIPLPLPAGRSEIPSRRGTVPDHTPWEPQPAGGPICSDPARRWWPCLRLAGVGAAFSRHLAAMGSTPSTSLQPRRLLPWWQPGSLGLFAGPGAGFDTGRASGNCLFPLLLLRSELRPGGSDRPGGAAAGAAMICWQAGRQLQQFSASTVGWRSCR